MKNKLIILLSWGMLLSCVNCTNSAIQAKNNDHHVKAEKYITEKKHKSYDNIVTKVDQKAAEIPKLYYKYLNEKKYNKAVKLLGPTLKFYGTKENRKYFMNLKHTEFLEYKDISKSGLNLDRVQEKYYAVKVYYAVIKIKVKDKTLVPGLSGRQSRNMFVVKANKNSDWKLDGDENVTVQQ